VEKKDNKEFEIICRIKLGRHGEKDEKEDLTPEGVADAENYGNRLEMEGVVHELTSDIPRAKMTGDLIFDKLMSKGGVKRGSELWADILNVKKVQASADREENHQTYIDIFKKYIADQVERLKQEEKRDPTPKEMKDFVRAANAAGVKENLRDSVYVENAASRFCYLLNVLVEWVKSATSIKVQREMVNFITVSHGSMLESFLKKTLIRKQGDVAIKGFEDVEEIGGVMEPTEFFEIDVMRNGEGEVKIKVNFDDPRRAANTECELDIEEIRRLAQLYKK